MARAGVHSFTYDDNGNMLSDFAATVQRERRFAWNYDNQPEWMWDYNGVATRLAFDAFGSRVLRWRGSEYTRYFGPFVEEPTTGGFVKNYYAGTTLIARGEFDPGSTGFIRIGSGYPASLPMSEAPRSRATITARSGRRCTGTGPCTAPSSRARAPTMTTASFT